MLGCHDHDHPRAPHAARVASSRDLSASLKKVWKAKITPDYCLKISKHIRKNMLAVVARKGGNFYKD